MCFLVGIGGICMKTEYYIWLKPIKDDTEEELRFLDLKKSYIAVNRAETEAEIGEKPSFEKCVSPTDKIKASALENMYQKATVLNLADSFFGKETKVLKIKDLEKNQLRTTIENYGMKNFWIVQLDNNIGLPGAGVLAVPKLLHQISVGFTSGFYIIPSSQMELIVFPDNFFKDTEELLGIVDIIKDVNQQDYVGMWKLSDNLYKYDSITKELTIAEF